MGDGDSDRAMLGMILALRIVVYAGIVPDMR
jgi:hypothetical protein